ncbi:MAG: flagellar hook-basal body complex protein [Candidatus Eremiobacteraeota bacterium]|nr:flagellar hook-basal body complex protein [Candidatus Eremiobacteraeota bacterium]
MAFDSLYTGITGLDAYQSQIDMISNNIANVGTTGFKGQRMTFADLFYQTTSQQGYATGPTRSSGGVDPKEIGLGLKINSIDTNFAQGGLETTGINTDLAINGDGFFIMRNPDGSGTPMYTRNGAFKLNQNGLLYDPGSGLGVQGYTADSTGNIVATGNPTDINIPLGLASQATGTGFGAKTGPTGDSVFDIAAAGNLDQTQWSKEQQGVANGTGPGPGGTGAGGTDTISTTIYDSLGVGHLATIKYVPDATGATAGPPATSGLPATLNDASGKAHTPATRWKVQVYFADGTQVGGAPATSAAPATLGYSYFDQNGQFINTSSLTTPTAATLHIAGQASSVAAGDEMNVTQWGNGASDLGTAPTGVGVGAAAVGAIGIDFSNTTSLAAISSGSGGASTSGSFTANILSQNGYGAGTLDNITIGQDGTVTGSFTNGQQRTLAQVALATFQNENGLHRAGGNVFTQTANSGLAQIGVGSSGRFGAVISGALEQSNVSLADAFTKLIVAQRAFEANSRGITTADQNLITITHLQASEN